jgi:hypothetical protein
VWVFGSIAVGVAVTVGSLILSQWGGFIISNILATSLSPLAASTPLLFAGSTALLAIRGFAFHYRFPFWSTMILQSLSVGGYTAAFSRITGLNTVYILPLVASAAMFNSFVMWLVR